MIKLHSLRICLLMSLLAGQTLVFAQDFTTFDCPVQLEGALLMNPWTGGFDAPQFSSMDANRDGIMDLFVFDRVGEVPMVFLGDGTGFSGGYHHAPEYAGMFPDMCCWVLLRDFNRDGIADIFTVPGAGGISGVQLYQGSIENGTWTFVPRRMGGEEGDEEILWYQLGSNKINVTVPFNDKPDIKDVDGDGDLDILTFDLGGSYVNYYRNLQEDRGLPADTMVFELHDQCFGKFRESGFSETIFLSDDPTKCATNFQAERPESKSGGLHSGSTVLAYDNDDDGDMDLILGDLTNRGLIYLENGGTASQNFMTSVDTNFPDYGLTVDMSIFLSGFNIDVTGDGLKDLIVSPNEQSSIANVENIWLYRNTGDASQRFSFLQSDFLSSESLDFGSFSIPVFVDENADGLMDIVVATDGEFIKTGPAEIALWLFRNTGTASDPVFQLVDDDYLGFRAFNGTSDNPAPAYGDLDGDGDTDLVIGDQEGQLYYFENRAGAGQPFDLATPVYRFMDIDVGQAAHPAITDLNGDGLGDLVIGERTSNFFDDTLGNINYFENQGSVGNPFFDSDVTQLPNYPVLGFMDTRLTQSAAERGQSAPVVVEIDGQKHFFLGSDKGAIKHYASPEGDLYGAYELVDSALGQIMQGRTTSPDLYDIDNDGYLEVLIGNRRGGLAFYNTPIRKMTTSVQESIQEKHIVVAPNPTNGPVRLTGSAEVSVCMVYDIQGRQVMVVTHPGQLIDLSGLQDGIYFMKFLVSDQWHNTRVIKY